MKIPSSGLLFGLIGYPVKHSFSAAMHNAAFNELGIIATYRLFEVPPESLQRFLLERHWGLTDTSGTEFFVRDINGFNITIPHKVAALAILRANGQACAGEIAPVEISGAVNTVKRNDRDLVYWNTDVPGFLTSLQKDLSFVPSAQTSVCVIGAGGAGRAVIAALADTVGAVYVYEKVSAAARAAAEHFDSCAMRLPQLKDKIKFIGSDQLAEVLAHCQLLVNASPVGMKEADGSPIDAKLLHKGLAVYDVVYNRKTKLVTDAIDCGAAASGGLGMLLYQGVYAFQAFTGQVAPIAVMERALKEELAK